MAKKIRLNDRKTPIIIATAYTDTTYLIKAVELQLVKYLVKPITSAKLQEALFLATQHLELNNIIQIEKSKLYDTLNKTLIIDDAVIKLSKNELLLLDILAKNHQRAITYQEIENYVWSESAMSIDALRSLVRAVRKKLQGDYVENISGIGYRLMIL